MKNKLWILLISLSFGVLSCDLGDDPDPGGTATEAIAGEYYIQLLSAPGGDLYVDYSLLTISNTAANSANQIRISDDAHFWGFNSVFNVDLASLTFSSDTVINALYDQPQVSPYKPIGTIDTIGSVPKYMVIKDGVVIPGVAHVPSLTTADSIAFYATGVYKLSAYQVVAWDFDTLNLDPLEIDTFNVFQFIEEIPHPDYPVPDGPYFLSGYRRTGFLEDEH
jgi:hypothetical protein